MCFMNSPLQKCDIYIYTIGITISFYHFSFFLKITDPEKKPLIHKVVPPSYKLLIGPLTLMSS